MQFRVSRPVTNQDQSGDELFKDNQFQTMASSSQQLEVQHSKSLQHTR